MLQSKGLPESATTRSARICHNQKICKEVPQSNLARNATNKMTARKCHNTKDCKEVPQFKGMAGKATIKRTDTECYNQKDYD